MTDILSYVMIAILIILLVAALTREAPTEEAVEATAATDYVQGLWDGGGLDLFERIFDSADYLWLRDEVGFPHLAQALIRARRGMALRWLKALKASFDELVRTPEPISSYGSASSPNPGGWGLLWATLHFHFLLVYALLVVRFFGPYHRMIPPLNWRHFVPRPSPRPRRFGTVDPGGF